MSQRLQADEAVLRACPMCRQHDRKHIATLTPGDDYRYDVAKCGTCGFVYMTNPKQNTADRGSSAALRENRTPALRHYRIRGLLAELFPDTPATHIVEIGAGHGLLAGLLQPDFDYLGFEPNAERAELCRRLGLNVEDGPFTAAGVEAGSIDAIVVDNVLEHVLDPEAIVRDAYAALRPGGVLVIIVPSISDIRRFIPKWRKRHYFQRVHINYFSETHLRKLYMKSGFTPKRFGFKGFDRPSLRMFPYALRDLTGVPSFGLYMYGVKQ